MAESEVLKPTILRLGRRSDVRLWRQNTGVALSLDGQRHIRFGIEGGGDASGIVAPLGVRLEIETKTLTGRASDSQRAFGQMIRAFGGIYIQGNDPVDIEAELDAELRKRSRWEERAKFAEARVEAAVCEIRFLLATSQPVSGGTQADAWNSARAFLASIEGGAT